MHKYQSEIESHRQSLALIQPEEAEKTCVICFTQPEASKLASLNSCSHQFCFECIKEWATKSANTCPLCKAKFVKISYKDEAGVPKELDVANRYQG